MARMRVIDVVNTRTICIYKTATTSIYSISRTTVARHGNLYDNNSIRVLSAINIFFSKRRLNGHSDSYHALRVRSSKSYHFNNARNVKSVNISNSTRLPRPSDLVDNTRQTRLKNLNNPYEMFRFVHMIQTHTYYIHLYT